jgi:hypothetical protein
MDPNIASRPAAPVPLRGTGGYTVNTPVYEGPLDLLLQLIERAELDITAIALAAVTDQYLTYIRALQNNARPDEISAFLVIATKLIQIKSEALLPRPPVREVGEEDPGESLVRYHPGGSAGSSRKRVYQREGETGAGLGHQRSESDHP